MNMPTILNAQRQVTSKNMNTFNDIVLDEQDYKQIEEKVALVAREVYQNQMPASNKSVLRQQLIKEAKENIWAARDFKDGFDSGESQTTPDFNHYEGTV